MTIIAYPDCALPHRCECLSHGYPRFETTDCVVPEINALARKLGWTIPYPQALKDDKGRP